MILQEEYKGVKIHVCVEKIRADPPQFRAVASVLHPLRGTPITGAELKALGMPAAGNGPTTKQTEASTQDAAYRRVKEKYAHLLAKVQPVLRVNTSGENELQTLYRAQAPTWSDWGKNKDIYIRNHLLPALGNTPLCQIDSGMLQAVMKQQLKKEEKAGMKAAEMNRHIRTVRSLFEHLAADGCSAAEKDPARELFYLEYREAPRSSTKRRYRTALSTKERETLFHWAEQHPGEWCAPLIFLVYNMRSVREICALNAADLTAVRAGGACFETVWIEKAMGKKGGTYEAGSIPPRQMRRVPVFACTKQALDAYSAGLQTPPADRPLLGKGPSGTVRVMPDEARAALAGLLRQLGISAMVQAKEPSTDDALVRLLEGDAAECARSVLCLRENEKALLTGQICSSTDAKHYWDGDCDETMRKLWLAGRRLAQPAEGRPLHTEHKLTIPAQGAVQYRCPGVEGGRLQVQLCADRAVTIRTDTVFGHSLCGGEKG